MHVAQEHARKRAKQAEQEEACGGGGTSRDLTFTPFPVVVPLECLTCKVGKQCASMPAEAAELEATRVEWLRRR